MNGYESVKKTNSSLTPATEEEFENGDHELFLDFRENPEGEVKVKFRNKLEKDQELKDRVKESDKENPNVIHLFLDTVSRQEFYRKYKKTVDFLEKRHNSKNKTERVSSFEFTKFHSIKPFTSANLFPSTYGFSEDFSNLNHSKSIANYFKEKGYINGFSTDSCIFSELYYDCKNLILIIYS